MRRFSGLAAAVLLAAMLPGCKVGPNYSRPELGVPPTYRGTDASARSLGDLKWMELFRDPTLQALVTEALVKNFDVRVAVARVLEARAQLAGAAANQTPSITAQAQTNYGRSPSSQPSTTYASWTKALGAQLQYEVDLWGRLSRATESARALFLAQDAARQAVLTTVVSNVVNAYLQLRELDLELDVSRRTLAARRDSLRLTQARLEGGVASLQDVRQAESLVYTAEAQIPDTQRTIEQTENALCVLLGRYPGSIPRGLPLLEQLNLPLAPAGVPSQLIERRPDIRQAEQSLIAANAQIGANLANYLPLVQITGSASSVNTILAGIAPAPINYGSLGIFSLVGSAGQLIFDGGRVRSGVDLAKARTEEAVAVYQGTIVQSVREVSDALSNYRQYQTIVAEQQKLTDALRDSVRLANLRYASGAASYLEVLNAESQDYSAELNLARAELAQRTSIVQLYKALGGGWQ